MIEADVDVISSASSAPDVVVAAEASAESLLRRDLRGSEAADGDRGEPLPQREDDVTLEGLGLDSGL